MLGFRNIMFSAGVFLTCSLGAYGAVPGDRTAEEVARAHVGSLRLVVGSQSAKARQLAFLRQIGLRDLGRALPTTPISLLITLKRRNQTEFDAAAHAGRAYRQTDFNNRFSPSSENLAIVERILRSDGFHVDSVSDDRLSIDVSSTARYVEREFKTELHMALQPGIGARYISVLPEVVPRSLMSAVYAVTGFTNVSLAQPMVRRANAAAKMDLASQMSAATIGGPYNGPSGGYGPAAFAKAYDSPANHNYTGTGRTISIIVAGNYLDSDLSTFESRFSVSRSAQPTRIYTDGTGVFSTNDNNWSLEATLDTQTIASQAPGATVKVYLTPASPSNKQLLDELNVANNAAPTVINASFGECESADPTSAQVFDYYAQNGEVRGTTLSASSGDGGNFTCSAYSGGNYAGGEGAFPASSPHWVAVGGTQLTGIGIPPTENAWNGSGGGLSAIFAAQAQNANCPVIMSGQYFSSPSRFYPDIALAADPSYGAALVYNSSNAVVGGTSLASPIFSAIQAEIDQQQNATRTDTVLSLYNAECSSGYRTGASAVFHDITTGTDYNYGPQSGWDYATGEGSIDGYNLGLVE